MGIIILLVEDDFDLAETVIQYLELEGIECDHATNGEAGLNLARENTYDVLILDIMLPRLDGLGICEAVRSDGQDTSVLMLTSRDTLEDKVAGFDAGTDDYLVKPFAMKELVARIKALAKRRSGQVRRLSVGDLVMDLNSREVWRSDKKLKLTPTGWILLETLMRSSPDLITRRHLEQALWNGEPPDSNSLKVHLHKLRQQVDKSFSKSMILTVPGHGFVLRP